MKYSVKMQFGYYEDDDTYHGPFQESQQIVAQSIDEAILKAREALVEKKRTLNEPENMTDGVVLRILSSTGKLLYDHALGILAEEARRAQSDEEVKENVLARIRKDPMIGRRARAALRAGSIAAIKAILGPAASIIIAIIEAWNDPDD